MYKFTKKLGLLALILSSSAFANKENFIYGAAGIGVFQADFANQFLDQTDIFPVNIVQSAQQYGYTGGLAIGYSRFITPNYFAGLEISGNVNNHNASFQSTAVFSDQVQIKSYFDLTFVPGIRLGQTVFAYLKLGLSYAYIRDSLTSPSGFTPVIITTNANKNALGFSGGLGIRKSLTKQLSIFVETNYHDYGSVDFSNFQNFSATYTHTTHPYSYDVMAGVLYSFNI